MADSLEVLNHRPECGTRSRSLIHSRVRDFKAEQEVSTTFEEACKHVGEERALTHA